MVENDNNEKYYESFHFTLLYLEANDGAMTEGNIWVFSFCDTVEFSDIDSGNFKEVERNTKKCTANPAYIFDAEQSRVETDSGDGYSRVRVYFERNLKQKGMQDLYVNTELNYRVGFNVYNSAVQDKS